MESIDPSLERRRREYVSSGLPMSVSVARDSSDLSTLSRFFKLMEENKIDGPYRLMEIRLVGKHLGSGAQFDVYGHRHVIVRGFPTFDEPYVSTRAKPSDPNGARPVVVAIKRPRLKLGFGDNKPELGFGTPTQLYALELEIHTLCTSSIRNHRNIVKLLAWGLEDDNPQYGVVEPLNPFLVLEHGNCSLHDFLAKDKGTIPWQVLQALTLDISQGLSVLHASKIIHGDLKADNVLVFPDQEGPFFCVAKLSDFGLAVTDQKEKIFNIGTPGWQAPELPSDEGIDAEMLVKCDYFSLGLVIII